MTFIYSQSFIHFLTGLFGVSSAGRALHRYHRGHGSRTGLNFFSGLTFATALVVFITAKITSLSAVQIYDFHIFIVRYGLISNKYFEKISEVDVVLVKKSNQPSKEGFCVSVKVKQHPSALSISPYWLSQLNGFTSFLSF